MIKAWLKRIVLWLGLLLCLYALWRARALAGDAFVRISPVGWLMAGSLLVAGWLFAVLAWRQYLLACTGHDPGWRMSARQLGLLLVGKYVPGGVFGFLARMYDHAGAPRHRLLWAGLAEQMVAVAMSIAVGGVLYATAVLRDLAWACLVIPLPLIAILGLWLLRHSTAWLPWLRRHEILSLRFPWRKLLIAASMQLIQQLAWAALVILLACELYGVDGYAASGVAGAFLLAVAAGMLAIFAPGGIGVREAALVGLASRWIGTEQAIFITALLRILNTLLDMGAGSVAVLSGKRMKNTEGNRV
ncbi:MAG: flippase-like domain-containing protein [Proteobacteria bacterium]|nr:flippase-like domain-containing protein [Pseudomonadota bacterium]MBS0216628.1 flippase-like domain-containing protein [Pseudomonadota bacterium]